MHEAAKETAACHLPCPLYRTVSYRSHALDHSDSAPFLGCVVWPTFSSEWMNWIINLAGLLSLLAFFAFLFYFCHGRYLFSCIHHVLQNVVGLLLLNSLLIYLLLFTGMTSIYILVTVSTVVRRQSVNSQLVQYVHTYQYYEEKSNVLLTFLRTPSLQFYVAAAPKKTVTSLDVQAQKHNERRKRLIIHQENQEPSCFPFPLTYKN